MLTPKEVRAVAVTGATFIVSPNCDLVVIERTKQLGLGELSGGAHADEAFAALAAGADALKVFPAGEDGHRRAEGDPGGAAGGTLVYAVGGVGPEGFAEWCAAGADGFGIGSSLFRPAWPVARVADAARASAAAWDATRGVLSA